MSVIAVGGTPADGLWSPRVPQTIAEVMGYMQYWDQFYSQPQDCAPELSRRELGQFMRRVKPLAGQTMIDVGCGRGTFAAAVSRLGVEVTGYDWSRVVVSYARRHQYARNVAFRRHDFTTGTDPEGVRPGRMDIVSCRLVLPYLNALAFLEDVQRWLRPDGTLYLVLAVNERHPGDRDPGYPAATIEWLREGWTHSERWDVDVHGAYTALALRGPRTA